MDSTLMNTPEILEAIRAPYGLSDTATISPLGNGHINRTALVSDGKRRMVAQQVNTAVFTRPRDLLYNARMIEEHLFGKEGALRVVRHVPDSQGRFLHGPQEDVRVLEYIPATTTVEVLEELRARHGVAGLWSHEETGDLWTFARDRRVAEWARTRGIAWTEMRQSGVVRRLKTRNGWAKNWDRFMAEPTTPSPQLAPLTDIDLGEIPDAAALALAPDLCPLRQRGGRAQALATLDGFLAERGATYRAAMSSPIKS